MEGKTRDTVDPAGASSPEGGRSPAAGRFLHASGSRPLEGYTVKRGVGQGGFGEIYYAVSDAGKEVALKLIRRNLDIELRGIRQCLNLKHPNLLALYDIRQDAQGDNWVVMEYVPGGCLEEVLATHPQGLPPEEALAWIRGIGAGVAYLHGRGIVHRDLKPANIFREEGLVKVGDYGLSKFISCSRRSGHTESIGTVHYMAPEVANGRYGKEIDIYALGVILYELLTGRVPFDGESVGEVLMKHLTAVADVSMLAEPYRRIVARCLEKDPSRRFHSVEELLAALPASPGAAPAAMPRAPAPVTAAVVEEPILRAVRSGLGQLRTAWDQNLNTPMRIAILLVGALLVLPNAAWLIPLAVMCAIGYGVYRLVRTIVLEIVSPRPSATYMPPTVPVQGTSPPAMSTYGSAAVQAARQKAVAPLVVKTPRERVTELIGSLCGGALVALAMGVVMVLLLAYRGQTVQPQQAAWLVLMGVAGVWSVLLPSKLWEGTRGEPMLRRFILMVVGLGLGALAGLMAETLMVRFAPSAELHRLPQGPPYQLPASFYAPDGRPLMMAFLAVFGTLLLVLRWWRQADPLRTARLSIWTTVVSVVAASIVAAAWHFPQPWLAMVAASMSISIQLASPWTPPYRQLRPQNKTTA